MFGPWRMRDADGQMKRGAGMVGIQVDCMARTILRLRIAAIKNCEAASVTPSKTA